MTPPVLLFRLSSLGDVVLTSSLFDPLLEAGYRPVLITAEPYGNLFADDRRVEVWEVPKKGFFKNLPRLLERVRRLSPAAVLDLHANLKGRVFRTLADAPLKVSYDKRSLFRRFCVLLNRAGLAGRLKGKAFWVPQAYAETLRILGLEVSRPRPKILTDAERTEETLRRLGLSGRRFVALGVGARYRKKRYPHFRKLAELFLREGFEVVLVGDRTDRWETRGWEGVRNLCGELSPVESLRVLGAAELFVGNDSGAAHMARAVGTPVAVVFGGTHPCLGFAPYPDEGKVVFKNLPCSPCDLHGRGFCKRNFECLEIPPERVLEEALSLLERRSAEGGV
ncbi:MAG: glycosyltransferase family 9 protein [Aquificae bacterium]|nr:glycosyltransferase family 9 protein [Aquificota bacterium]